MGINKNLLKIFHHFGERNQLKKLNEEAYELCEAILVKDDKEHITEEVADVLIMLGQIILAYDIDNSKINEIVDSKIERTLMRIDTKKLYKE